MAHCKRSISDEEDYGSSEGDDDLSDSSGNEDADMDTELCVKPYETSNSEDSIDVPVKTESNQDINSASAVIKSETSSEVPGGNTPEQKKSQKQLKTEVRSLMRLHGTNSGDYAVGGSLTDAELTCMPLIEVAEYGLLPFPLNDVTFQSVKKHCRQSPYGLGEETLLDTKVRNSYQLEPDQFKINNSVFNQQIDNLIQKKIKDKLGLAGVTVCGKIYKLLMYEAGGKFDEHTDTEKEDNMFGTLIVQLPSLFKGGDPGARKFGIC